MMRKTVTRNNSQLGALPEKRFPEFQNTPAWGLKSIGEILSESRIPSLQSVPTRRITVRLHGQGVEHREYRGTESPEATLHFTRKAGQFIYGKQNIHRGAFGIIPPHLDGFETSQDLPAFDFSADYCPRWFLYYLSRERYYSTLERKMTGTGSKRLNEKVFLAQPIYVPAKPEQQKIAECLSTLDELIEVESRKLVALKAHKKGLMQHLFPREGETRPRLRFPEFLSAPEWKVYPFEKFVAKTFYGTSSATSSEGRYPVLRMGNMVDGGLNFENLVYIDLDSESFESFRLKDGDLLLNRTNSPALVGKVSLFRANLECLTASYIVTYRLKKRKLDPAICNFMLNSPQYQAKIRSLAKPSISQANINPTSFRKDLIIAVPEAPEQHRIAACLASLDDLIAAQSCKLDALRTHKRGLIQQLFPSVSALEA